MQHIRLLLKKCVVTYGKCSKTLGLNTLSPSFYSSDQSPLPLIIHIIGYHQLMSDISNAKTVAFWHLKYQNCNVSNSGFKDSKP